MLLAGAGAGLGLWAYRRPGQDEIPGALLGQSHRVGHRLRDAGAIAFRETEATGVAIVGGGIAGLSTAWWLDRQGFSDYRVLELEAAVGGNSRSGANDVTPYPWGAHYVPLPGKRAELVRALFEELGVIKDGRYEETYLCAEPQERLLVRGRWQEGIVPREGDREQYRRFFAYVSDMRETGAFTIPVAYGSPDYRSLDGITMGQLLRERGWTCPYLTWYVDYCCRDDYGTSVEETSAWAGVHYFASRGGNTVLTWPEGNGWIVGKLARPARTATGRLVMAVRAEGSGFVVESFDTVRHVGVRTRAKAVVVAAPRFVAARLVAGLSAKGFTYAPWMVANVTVENPPPGLAWDNVKYGAESLGYIVATHQGLHPFPKRTVFTVYFPLLKDRAAALATTYPRWQAKVIRELEGMHPGIRPEISRVDVWIWGHAMVRPVPGFFRRPRTAVAGKGIFLAHSDLSGLSLFEEAQYHGVKAAEGALRHLGLRSAGVA